MKYLMLYLIELDEPIRLVEPVNHLPNRFNYRSDSGKHGKIDQIRV